MSNEKQCHHCRGRGSRYNADMQRRITCEDCLGLGKLQWCDRCKRWYDKNRYWSDDEDLCKYCLETVLEWAADDLLAALEITRGQWIHSIHADQCLNAIAKAKGENNE